MSKEESSWRLSSRLLSWPIVHDPDGARKGMGPFRSLASRLEFEMQRFEFYRSWCCVVHKLPQIMLPIHSSTSTTAGKHELLLILLELTHRHVLPSCIETTTDAALGKGARAPAWVVPSVGISKVEMSKVALLRENIYSIEHSSPVDMAGDLALYPAQPVAAACRSHPVRRWLMVVGFRGQARKGIQQHYDIPTTIRWRVPRGAPRTSRLVREAPGQTASHPLVPASHLQERCRSPWQRTSPSSRSP